MAPWTFLDLCKLLRLAIRQHCHQSKLKNQSRRQAKLNWASHLNPKTKEPTSPPFLETRTMLCHLQNLQKIRKVARRMMVYTLRSKQWDHSRLLAFAKNLVAQGCARASQSPQRKSQVSSFLDSVANRCRPGLRLTLHRQHCRPLFSSGQSMPSLHPLQIYRHWQKIQPIPIHLLRPFLGRRHVT